MEQVRSRPRPLPSDGSPAHYWEQWGPRAQFLKYSWQQAQRQASRHVYSTKSTSRSLLVSRTLMNLLWSHSRSSICAGRGWQGEECRTAWCAHPASLPPLLWGPSHPNPQPSGGRPQPPCSDHSPLSIPLPNPLSDHLQSTYYLLLSANPVSGVLHRALAQCPQQPGQAALEMFILPLCR